MSKFSRWTPTLGVCFKWDSQKVLKIAHLGVFRHIGGTWGVQKHMYLKVYWVKVISSKNGDVWTPQCWEMIFFRQNICMFDWLYTETYSFAWFSKITQIFSDAGQQPCLRVGQEPQPDWGLRLHVKPLYGTEKAFGPFAKCPHFSSKSPSLHTRKPVDITLLALIRPSI